MLGTTCDDQKFHFFKPNWSTEGRLNDGDPFYPKPSEICPRGAVYSTDQNGVTKGGFDYANGYGYDDTVGRVVVVHDMLIPLGGDYSAIGCGVLEHIDCPPPPPPSPSPRNLNIEWPKRTYMNYGHEQTSPDSWWGVPPDSSKSGKGVPQWDDDGWSTSKADEGTWDSWSTSKASKATPEGWGSGKAGKSGGSKGGKSSCWDSGDGGGSGWGWQPSWPTPPPTWWSSPPTNKPSAPPSAPPTAPPSAPPTNPPSQGPTQPPTNPPTSPPTAPPTAPPTNPPSQGPTQPPTNPPTQPPTNPPTQKPSNPPSPPPTNSPTNAFVPPPTPKPTPLPTTISTIGSTPTVSKDTTEPPTLSGDRSINTQTIHLGDDFKKDIVTECIEEYASVTHQGQTIEVCEFVCRETTVLYQNQDEIYRETGDATSTDCPQQSS